ncbi:MAG: hypothetical protein R6U50_09145 [Desulfobacterales bacterium]
MTSAQITILVAVLVVCCLALFGMIYISRPKHTLEPLNRLDDRESILAMLTRVKDRFSLSIYKRAYDIRDDEIAAQKKKIDMNT